MLCRFYGFGIEEVRSMTPRQVKFYTDAIPTILKIESGETGSGSGSGRSVNHRLAAMARAAAKSGGK